MKDALKRKMSDRVKELINKASEQFMYVNTAANVDDAEDAFKQAKATWKEVQELQADIALIDTLEDKTKMNVATGVKKIGLAP